MAAPTVQKGLSQLIYVWFGCGILGMENFNSSVWYYKVKYFTLSNQW